VTDIAARRDPDAYRDANRGDGATACHGESTATRGNVAPQNMGGDFSDARRYDFCNRSHG